MYTVIGHVDTGKTFFVVTLGEHVVLYALEKMVSIYQHIGSPQSKTKSGTQLHFQITWIMKLYSNCVVCAREQNATDIVIIYVSLCGTA